MRTALLCAVLLLMAFPVLADPGLTVIPDGPVVRGRVTTFSIQVTGVNITKLWDLSFKAELNEYLTGKANFAGPKGVVLLVPGPLLQGEPPIMSGPKADGKEIMKGHPLATQKSGSGGVFKNFFLKTISKPGELFRLYIYVPIDFKPANLGVRTSIVPVLISSIEAHDSQGNPITVSLDYHTVTVDLRRFGDVNNDGATNQSDTIRILQGIVGLRPLTDVEQWYADVQPATTTGVPMDTFRYLGDGHINLGDAMRTLMYLVGLWDQYWWPDKVVTPPACDPNDPTCVPACDPNDPTCVPACDPNDPTCQNPPTPP